MYDQGLGVPENDAEAVKCYHKAAEEAAAEEAVDEAAAG